MGLWETVKGWVGAGAGGGVTPRLPALPASPRTGRKARAIDELTVDALLGQHEEIPDRVKEPLDAFTGNVWAHACASRNAEVIASIRLRHVDAQGNDLPELPPLLANPNPAMSFFEHVELVVVDLHFTGESFEWVADDGLWRLSPARTKPISHPKKRISHFEYDLGNGKKYPIPVEQMVYRRLPNPQSEIFGLGPGGVALDVFRLDEQMDKYQVAFIKNGSRLSWIIESELELTRRERRRLLAEWIHAHAGASKAGTTAMMSHGLKAREAGETHKEMEFLEGKRFGRDTIITAMGTPPCLVGVFDDANYSNTDNQLKIFYDFKVRTYCRRLAPGWNACRAIVPNPLRSHVEFDEQEINDRVVDPEKMARVMTLLYDSGLYGAGKLRKKFLRDGPIDDEERADLKPIPAPVVPFGFGSAALPAEIIERRALERVEAELKGWIELARRPFSLQLPPSTETRAERKSAALARLLRRSVFDKAADTKAFGTELRQLIGKHQKLMVPGIRRRLTHVLNDALDKLDRANAAFGGTAVKAARPNKALQKALIDELTFDIDDYINDLVDDLEPELEATLRDTARASLRSLGLDEATFDHADPRAVRYAKEQAVRASKFALTTTRDDLRAELAEGIEAGETLADLKKRIEGLQEGIDESRAETIARTEALGAGQFGAFEGYRQSEVVDRKRWLTTSPLPRASHAAAMAAGAIPLDGVFPNGLQFPGDSSTDQPGEVANCACTLEPVLIGEEA